MSHFVPKAVIRAAEARAAGASWPAAAAEAGWDLPGLRRWVREHQPLWAREVGRARRDARDAACDEAVAVLRKQLRAQEAKTALSAANTLAARFVPRTGRTTQAKGTMDDDYARAEAYVNGLTPGELARLEHHLEPMPEQG